MWHVASVCFVNSYVKDVIALTRDDEISVEFALVDANSFVSGRFFHLWSELDDLSTLFRGPPFHAFSEVGRYVELDYLCHS